MTDRVFSGPASFSGHDRRRLAMTLKQTSEVPLFRRVQAVRRVAEGDTVRSVARSLRISRRSVQSVGWRSTGTAATRRTCSMLHAPDDLVRRTILIRSC
jgi:ribosomal protein L39E